MPLSTWWQVSYEFLINRVHPDKPNDFKWKGFTMTEDEIKNAVTEAVYRFAEARIDLKAHRIDECKVTVFNNIP